MKLGPRSSIADVMFAVGEALRRHDVGAVLTGGACATYYTRGTYQSVDLDFVLSGRATQAVLDMAMASIGFSRHRDRYVHPLVKFYVEFPRGPLAIGEDLQIRPVLRRRRGLSVRMLSATDACRDRLAAFYHWSDRQSLRVAVNIAMNQRISLRAIQEWSDREGAEVGFEEFLSALQRARSARRARS